MLNTKTQEHEIVCVCGLVSTKFYLEKATMPTTIKNTQNLQITQTPLYESYFCALTKPSTAVFPYDLQNVVKSYQQKFKIEICASERALLAYFLGKIHSLDVDILVGHDLFGFNFDIILNRCVVKKVPHWSRIGRLKRSTMPNMHHSTSQKAHSSSLSNLITQQRVQTVCAGRLLSDVMLSAKELLTKCKSFDLIDLVQHILKIDVTVNRNLDEEKQVANYYANSQLLIKFLQLTMMDATYMMRICNDLQCLQLAYQITCIAGNVLSRTLVGGRSERNEYLLLHAFHDKDFLLPEKRTNQFKAKQHQAIVAKGKSSQVKRNTQTESANQDGDDDDDEKLLSMDLNVTATKLDSTAKPTQSSSSKTAGSSHTGYAGGLVLEPRVGFYDRFILLLDFNSLYPSIIQEYNICFTTIGRPDSLLAETNMDEYLETCIKMPSSEEKQGILPLEIKKLVDSRRQVKQLMADKSLSADLRMQYDIRQKALKLTANSMYGCLGFENSRFYCKPLAALITKNGRSLLMKTKELVEMKKIEVIYGDTDSIMVNTNLNDYDQVIKLGNMLKAEVNKLYKHLEIDIDGVYKCLLLLRKKKYAALTVTGRNPIDKSLQYQQEIKGLDVVRRDWCILAKQTGEKVISEILSGQACDIVLTNINKILNETAEKIANNSYDLSVFEISKQLNRNPEEYSDSVHQPHVLVALRHNMDASNNKKFKSGNVIAYVVCEDGTQNTSTQRAYSKSELLKSPETLKLDTNYYLTQQIHPVVTRLCEPIEGIDAYHVAQSLGLDPAGFKHKSHHASSTSNGLTIAPPQQLTKQQKKLESYMNEIEKYSNCVPFKYVCTDCKTETLWQCPFVKLNHTKKEPVEVKPTEPVKSSLLKDLDLKMEQDEFEDDNEDDDEEGNNKKKKTIEVDPNFKCILDACSNVTCKTKPTANLNYIKNSLTLQLSSFIRQYYQFWLVCDDPMCSFRTKRLSCKFVKGKAQCVECERYATCLEYTDSDLYYQMKFFKFIFDIEAYKNYYKDDAVEIANLLRSKRELTNGLNQLKEHANKKLKNNVYGKVNLSDLFKRIA
jgi:DNA polymerase alpha subunit A